MVNVTATPDALLEETEAGLMLLHAVTEHYYRLDGLGRSLWQQLVVEGASLETVVERMASEHHAEPEVVRRDLLAFIEQLRLAGFVTVTSGAGPVGES